MATAQRIGFQRMATVLASVPSSTLPQGTARTFVPPPYVDYGAKYGIPVLRLDDRGRDLARVHVAQGGNGSLVLEHARLIYFVHGKDRNQSRVIPNESKMTSARAGRDGGNK